MKFYLSLLMMLFLSISGCFASPEIEIQEGDVTINGITIENSNREYPLISYNDITYFPMTWFDSRFLGIETTWDSVTGLDVSLSNVTTSYQESKMTSIHLLKAVQLPAFDITINGEQYLDEDYPFLLYNNVTYFPLTWAIAHDMLNWTYEWQPDKGLFVNSMNPLVKDVELPVYASNNDVILFNNYYYFVESNDINNMIYKAPVSDLSNIVHVYTYEYSQSYGKHSWLTFRVIDNDLWFFYHSGGSVMGSDVHFKITETETIEQYRGYLDFINSEYGNLVINYGVPPSRNNLTLDNQSIGDSNNIYGWRLEMKGSNTSMGRSMSEKIVNNLLYILGSNQDEIYLNRLYTVDLKSGETTVIIDENVSDFKIVEDKLYYITSEGLIKIFRSGQKTVLGDYHLENVSKWHVTHGGYLHYLKDGIYYVYDLNNNNNIVTRKNASCYYTKDDLIILQLKDDDYGVVVYAESGTEVIRVTAQVERIYLSNHLLFKTTDGVIKEMKLTQ